MLEIYLFSYRFAAWSANLYWWWAYNLSYYTSSCGAWGQKVFLCTFFFFSSLLTGTFSSSSNGVTMSHTSQDNKFFLFTEFALVEMKSWPVKTGIIILRLLHQAPEGLVSGICWLRWLSTSSISLWYIWTGPFGLQSMHFLLKW